MSIFVDKLYDYIQAKRAAGYAYLGYSVYNVTKDDLKFIEDAADYFGFRPEWLANLINFESAGTFNPAIQNSIGATGLIQFMPATASQTLGTTTTALKQMTFAQQMVYVNKYIYNWYKQLGWVTADGKPMKNKASQIDLYMMIFYPAAVGKSAAYQFPASVVAANAGTKTPQEYFDKAIAVAPFKTLLDLGEKAVGIVKKKPALIVLFVIITAGLVISVIYRKQIVNYFSELPRL